MPAAILLAVLIMICTVSTVQRWLLFRPAVEVLAADTARDFIAAALWIPLGACAVLLARRFPLRRETTLRHLPVHLLAGAIATALLNLCWAAVVSLVGLWPDASVGFARLVARYAIGFLHIDVPIWLLIVTAATAWRPAPEGVAAAANGNDDALRGRLAIRQNGRTTLVDVGRIDWIEAAGDYARLHVEGRSYLIGERMHALEERLESGFVRVHRSAIVNLARVREVRHRPAGDATLVLRDDTTVPLSRRRRAAVLALLDPRAGES